VYFVSRAMLKTANRQYSKIDNDYEMTFTNDTVIEQCHESADNIPHMNLAFIKLSEVANKSANDFVGK
jgi:replication factor A1